MSFVRCHCSWPDCDAMFKNINELSPANHVWNGPSIRLEFGSNDSKYSILKKSVLQKSVFMHCLTDDSFGNLLLKNNLFIRRHHYPTSLLEYREKHGIKQFAKF